MKRYALRQIAVLMVLHQHPPRHLCNRDLSAEALAKAEAASATSVLKNVDFRARGSHGAKEIPGLTFARNEAMIMGLGDRL